MQGSTPEYDPNLALVEGICELLRDADELSLQAKDEVRAACTALINNLYPAADDEKRVARREVTTRFLGAIRLLVRTILPMLSDSFKTSVGPDHVYIALLKDCGATMVLEPLPADEGTHVAPGSSEVS